MLIEMFFQCLNFFLTYLEACDQAPCSEMRALFLAHCLSGQVVRAEQQDIQTKGNSNTFYAFLFNR